MGVVEDKELELNNVDLRHCKGEEVGRRKPVKDMAHSRVETRLEVGPLGPVCNHFLVGGTDKYVQEDQLVLKQNWY